VVGGVFAALEQTLPLLPLSKQKLKNDHIEGAETIYFYFFVR